jgi:hypothetical protein
LVAGRAVTKSIEDPVHLVCSASAQSVQASPDSGDLILQASHVQIRLQPTQQPEKTIVHDPAGYTPRAIEASVANNRRLC